MRKLLQKIGLEDSEAKTYLALLELGPSTVSEITRQAQITRTLGYHALEKLSWLGLVDRVTVPGKKISYHALHPHNLRQYVKSRRQQWARNLQKVEQSLPQLVSLYKLAEKPVVHYHEGLAGIKKIANETLAAKKEMYTILDVEEWNALPLKTFGRQWDRERSKKGIKEKQLLLKTAKAQEWMKYFTGSPKNTEVRWLDPKLLSHIKDFKGEINIYDNKVAMLLLAKPNRMGIIIESATLANILKSLFTLAWRQGTALTKKSLEK